MRRAATLALALSALAAPAQASAADRPPAVPGAKAAIVIDGIDGEVMFAKHPNARHGVMEIRPVWPLGQE